MTTNKRTAHAKILLVAAGSGAPLLVFSQQASPSAGTCFSNALFNTLLLVIIVLAIMVLALASALKNVIGSDAFVEKLKREREQNSGVSKTTAMVVLFMLLNGLASAQDKIQPVTGNGTIGGLDQATFYSMLTVIAIELLVLGIVFNTFKNVLGVSAKASNTNVARPKTKTMLDQLNGTVEIGKEESILLDHDYDGIKELDNNLPPWWKYGFYLTILTAVVYLVNYHVIRTSPLQKQEYANSIKKAEAEIAEYMKGAAGNVDENTVKLLQDAADLASGRDLFISSCGACHGRSGEGGVGPNLTDDYWLHGGSVKSIFKTIKYGWPDKGMKSWKEDLSPVQIAQITGFIRSIRGTTPANAKDRQGELYLEQLLPADSMAVKADTAKTLSAERQ